MTWGNRVPPAAMGLSVLVGLFLVACGKKDAESVSSMVSSTNPSSAGTTQGNIQKPTASSSPEDGLGGGATTDNSPPPSTNTPESIPNDDVTMDDSPQPKDNAPGSIPNGDVTTDDSPQPEDNTPSNIPINDAASPSPSMADTDAARPADCYDPDTGLPPGSMLTEGCPCEDVGGACVATASLICYEGHWLSVIDGPCFEGIDCEGKTRSALDCVELFDICQEQSDGLHCGQGRRTDLCNDGAIVPDATFCEADAACDQLSNGMYCTTGFNPCPGGAIPDDGCVLEPPTCFSTGFQHCRVPTITLDECEPLGGEVISDPGDGSVFEHGCPDGRTLLGINFDCTEGCLCCAVE